MVWSWLDVLKAVVILVMKTYLRRNRIYFHLFSVFMAFFQTFCDVDEIDSDCCMFRSFCMSSFIYQNRVN